MSDITNILVVGTGGQGVMTATEILAEAAIAVVEAAICAVEARPCRVHLQPLALR